MIGRMLRFVLTRGGEAVFAVGLVLVFFLMFMGLLSLTFPEGTNLADLMRSERVAGRARPSSPRGIDILQEDAQIGGPIAVLSRVLRNVKDKPADAIAWSDSRTGLPLRTTTQSRPTTAPGRPSASARRARWSSGKTPW